MNLLKKKPWLLAVAILAGCIALAVVLVLLRDDPPRRPPEAQAPLVRTVPAEVRSGPIPVAGSGTVQPLEEVTLAAEVAGKLVYVHPRLVAGGRVARGDVLLRIDPADYGNAVDQARADVAQQQVAVLQAEEEAALARDEYARFEAREARRALSPYASVDPDDYAARILPPEALADDTPADDAPAGPSRLALREPQQRAAEAALARARARLADAALALDRTVVRAPFAGLVRSENVAVGGYVAPGQALAQVVASDAVEVVVPLTRDEAALVPGLWADAGRVPAAVYASYGGFRYRWDGFVDRARAVLDPQTRTIDVVVRVPAPLRGGALLRPADADDGVAAVTPAQAPPLLVGDFVQVTLDGVAPARYVVVPRAALRPDGALWVVRDSVLQIVPAAVVQQVDDDVYVLADAVEAGAPVVVTDLRVATDGMRVRLPDARRTGDPVPAASSAAPAADNR